MGDTTLAQDARELRELKQHEKAANEEYESIKRRRKECEYALLQRMQDEEADGIKTDGNNFVPAKTTYAAIQDRGEFIAWALEHDEELVEHKERKQLLNQLVRERLDNGEPLPPGLGFYDQEYVSIRAS